MILFSISYHLSFEIKDMNSIKLFKTMLHNLKLTLNEEQNKNIDKFFWEIINKF